MKDVSSTQIKKYIFWASVIILFVLSILIVWQFVVALISAFILAYLVKPVHSKLSTKLNTHFSAILCVIIILGIIIIPFTILAGAIINQISVSESFDLNSLTEKISSLEFLNNYNLNTLKENILSSLLSLLTSAISHLPYFILSILISILGIYYILVNWNTLSEKLESLIPFNDRKRIRIEISQITRNIVYGYLLIALIEFIVAFTGFYLSGVGAYLILASLIALFAFIPGLGPGVIWIPTALYYLITGNYATALGVLITGLIISIIIETIILGKIMSKGAKIHPLIFLLGVLGGVPIFGIFGFIIGPLILVYTIKLLEESIK